ncbi:hypothetical protein SAMN06296386_11536 [Lachnospiraceae bacterium]|nr:hypothetical protein SAMN06296386_11536 [Lachnospiraceae bacterium]
MEEAKKKPGKRHPMSNEHRFKLVIDACNLLIGLVVTVMSIISMSIDTDLGRSLYPILFWLGAAMMALNSIRFIRSKNLLPVLFLLVAVVLTVVGIYAS